MTTTYDKKFNAQRGAQRTGLKPGEYEIFKTEDGRFGWRPVAEVPTAVTSEPESFEPPAFLRRAEADAAEANAEQEAVHIDNLHASGHPTATENAASWPSGPKRGKRAAIVEQAKSGTLPNPPDFSKPTHTRFRAKLAKLVAMAEASDIEGLKAFAINPVSTSPKAMARYRDLAVLAIEARTGAK